MFQELKVDALKCDARYWKCQGKKATTSGQARPSAFTATPTKSGNPPTSSADSPKPAHGNVGPQFRTDGKLTEAENECHCSKDSAITVQYPSTHPPLTVATPDISSPQLLVAPLSQLLVNLMLLLRK